MLNPFDRFWATLKYWDTSDPGLACAQRAWNAGLVHAAARVKDREARQAILADVVHERDMLE